MSNWKWDDNNSSSSCFCFITVDPVDNLFKILQKKKSDVTDLKSIVAFFLVYLTSTCDFVWHTRGATLATEKAADSWQLEVRAIPPRVQQGVFFPLSLPGKEMASPISQGSLPKSTESLHDAVLFTQHFRQMRPPGTPSLPYLMTVHFILHPTSSSHPSCEGNTWCLLAGPNPMKSLSPLNHWTHRLIWYMCFLLFMLFCQTLLCLQSIMYI